MSNDRFVNELLRQAGETVAVDPRMPSRVHKRIRLRQAGLVLVAAAGILGLGLTISTALVDQEQHRMPPAKEGREAPVEVLVEAERNGIPWRIELRRARGDAPERVCFVAGKTDQCWNSEHDSYGSAVVGVGYVRPLRSSLVIVGVPPGADVSMREISGTNWAAFSAHEADPGSDDMSYYYRLFEGPSVRGVLTVGHADVPNLEFHIEADGPNVRTGLSVTTEFPELRAFPGDKQLLASGPEGGGYSVILRTTGDEVCLHVSDVSRCADRSADSHPIRLWIMTALPCTRDDACSGEQLTLIAGVVAPEVDRIGIRERDGISYSQVGEPYAPRSFAMTLDGRPDPGAEIVAFGDAGDESGSVPIEP